MVVIDSSRVGAQWGLALAVVIVIMSGCAGNDGGPVAAETENVRSAQFAGMFYPGDSETLRENVKKYLSEAEPQVPSRLQKVRPAALVVPHAGYRYSGRTAAHAYRLLKDTKKPTRIVLLGPSHRVRMGSRVSVPPYSACRTPLGELPIDVEARDVLAKTDVCISEALVHNREHSLEVQLPFLQALWQDPPPVLPIVVGQLDAEGCRTVAEAVASVADENTLLIVSSDFTHYGSRFGFTPFSDASGEELMTKIRELDVGAVERMKQCDPAGFRDYVEETGATICGADPITVMLEMCCPKKGQEGRLLHYSTSADATSGSGSSVSYVAYAAWSGTEKVRRQPEEKQTAEQEDDSSEEQSANDVYSEQQKRTLLRTARKAIEGYVKQGESPEVDPADYCEKLRRERGAFVTLKKNGQLRGCMGYVAAVKPLVHAVADMAVRAASKDPRFQAVREQELSELSIEISVLSPFREVKDPQNVKVGTHGLMIVKGRRSGLLLPQVPTEQSWDRKEFLQGTCRKAGLPPDGWKDAKLYTFTAHVFGEDDSEGS